MTSSYADSKFVRNSTTLFNLLFFRLPNPISMANRIILIIKFHSLIYSLHHFPRKTTLTCQNWNDVKGIWHFLIPSGNQNHFPSITFNAAVTVFILYSCILCYNVSHTNRQQIRFQFSFVLFSYAKNGHNLPLAFHILEHLSGTKSSVLSTMM